MTTSITDARYTSLHFTPGTMIALEIDDPPETGWSVMPGYDENIPFPAHLELPRPDADETLPNLVHPSYPFGRPVTKTRNGLKGTGNLLGTLGGDGVGMAERWGKERWDEVGLDGVMEGSDRREVPPGMAGAKRPPSPPSPPLNRHQAPQPRSHHLQNLYARQQNLLPRPSTDAFDAPVPNETYPAHERANDSRGDESMGSLNGIVMANDGEDEAGEGNTSRDSGIMRM